jgi:alcohol dehydrogenase (NADP+)
VFPVPPEIPLAQVAPMFCAGLTVFSPLKQHGVCQGTRVGVIGIGGLGHYAVMFACAMGATVTAISHSPRKKQDATEMGAQDFLTTAEPGWEIPAARSLDLIICTSFDKGMALDKYLSLLDVGGTMVYVGIPEANLPSLPPTLMIGNNSALRGSNTGSRKEVMEMLDLVVSKKIQSWVEEIPMSQCSEAIQKQLRGESRYRYVLKRDW